MLKVFVDLYNEGLIYKDKRLVNWDPEFQTRDLRPRGRRWSSTRARSIGRRATRTKPFDAKALGKVLDRDPIGHMYHFRYPLTAHTMPDDATTYIVVATTRPETMLGDTAVAVHPEDRALQAPGRPARSMLPLVGREIPIVADDYSDPEKGSGAVKITPAHDFNDFEVGKRHELALINIFDATAQLNDEVPENYRGLDRFAARKRVVADLEALGLSRRSSRRRMPCRTRSAATRSSSRG